MNTTIRHSAFIFLFIVASAVPLIAQDGNGDLAGSVTFTTVATPDWRIAEIDGTGVATQGSTNAMTLEIGGRYTFNLSNVDSETYPMEIRDGSGAVIISQHSGTSAEEFEAADISVDEDEIQFTLTEELASRISFYRAATYPSMIGVIRTYTQDREQEQDQDEETEGD